MILKQATVYTRLFLMVQSADHISGITGMSPIVKLSKAGGAGFTASNSPATEVDSTNFPGLYKISLSTTDTNQVGDLAYECTVATASGSADHTTFVDQVQTIVFSDLNIDASGNIAIASNIKKNQALLGFTFVMTNSSTNAPQAGLSVAAQRSLNGAGFGPCANPVTEISNGIYSINFAATDLNANTVMFRATAVGANDQDILLITTLPSA